MSKPSVNVTVLGNGVFQIEHADGQRRTAYGVVDGAKTWVFVDGVTYVVEPAQAGRSAAAHDATALAAPMPATVTHVHVAAGQRVTRGDVLITLEAMKMELPIRAAGDGIVASVNCRVGELVQPGVPLLELRDEPRPEPEHQPGSEQGEA